MNTAPSTRPPNWTRSRIRRQHLISLGIPVNLDEISVSKALPALQITTRPMSAPPGPRPDRLAAAQSSNLNGGGGRGSSRVGTPTPGSPARTPNASSTLAIGPKPSIDRERINKALALDPGAPCVLRKMCLLLMAIVCSDSLPLMPLTTLQAHLESLRALTASTSDLLSHLLQTRDALQQDSDTYNGLIAELVGEAQKMKTGGAKKPTKRGSAFG